MLSVAVFSAAGFFVQTPFGPRKSGMPESVEMPAPVSTTTRCASRTALLARPMGAAGPGISAVAYHGSQIRS